MDRREAIQKIEAIIDNGQDYGYWTDAQRHALDLAIETLKGDLHCPKCGTIVRDGRQYHDLVYRGETEKLQLFGETSTNSNKNSKDNLSFSKKKNDDIISRQVAGKTFCALCNGKRFGECEYSNTCKSLRALQSVPPVNQKQIISKLESEQMREYIPKDEVEVAYKADIDNLPPVEPTHGKHTETHGVCSDCISRQQAIEAMWKALYAYEDLTEKQFMEHEELELGDWFQHRIFVQRMHEESMKSVESLPPVTSTVSEDCISRADTIKTMCAECVWDDCHGDVDCNEVAVVRGMPPVNQKQITGKLENAENATSKGEESTMGQPKSKLDCISRQQAIEAIEGVDWYHVNSKLELERGSRSDEESWYKAEDIYKAIESLPPVTPKEQTDCTDLINWLLEEVLDEENWELNAVANGEIICRKLKKLGLLEVKDGYYVRASVTPTERTGEIE